MSLLLLGFWIPITQAWNRATLLFQSKIRKVAVNSGWRAERFLGILTTKQKMTDTAASLRSAQDLHTCKDSHISSVKLIIKVVVLSNLPFVYLFIVYVHSTAGRVIIIFLATVFFPTLLYDHKTPVVPFSILTQVPFILIAFSWLRIF